MKRKIKTGLIIVIIIIAFLLIEHLLVPKYQTSLEEGNFTYEYYNEDKNHEVIFIGDCEVYSNFNPLVLYEEYGITSYIRGNSQQMIWQAYYLLKETLKYEIPKIVILNINAMRYDKVYNEGYNRLMFDKMKPSLLKYQAIKESLTEKESLLEYVFPILRYHSRWSELSSEDFKYYFETNNNTYNGYQLKVAIKGAENIKEGKKLGNYTFSNKNYEYLNKIKNLCQENNIELILIKAPSLTPYWYQEYEKQIIDYARINNLKYINFLDYITEIGLDYSKDTFDYGAHLNVYGADKLTKYMGSYLKENFDLIDHRNNPQIDMIYLHKIKEYKEKLMKEIKKYETSKNIDN